jgi:thioredoxin 1
MALHVTDANFESEVINADVPVLVDLWAEWCGPCRMIAPIIEEMATEYEGRAKMVKLDVDENPMTPGKYGVRNIPTVLFFKNGEVVDKVVGAVPKSVFVEKLNAIL